MDSLNPHVVPTPTISSPPRSWLRQNFFTLIFGVAVIALVLKYLNPFDFILGALGLGFIIFIHELGHFMAAKFCGVYVKTFAVGFGPALPFCSFKYGETTYKLAVIPLGGFVSMAGQEDGVVDDSEDTDPRSFKNKKVWQRMLIISAGVIMNILFAAVCFVVAYTNGVEESPAIVANTHPGSAAWRAGLHSGTEFKKIGSRENPWFEDIIPIVWATSKGEQLPATIEYQGVTKEIALEPIREDGSPVPVIGFGPPSSLTLRGGRRDDIPVTQPGTSAAKATSPDGGVAFKAGDRIIAMTDPDSPANAVSPVADGIALQQRMQKLAGKPIEFDLRRKGQTADAAPVRVKVEPAFHTTTGIRMRMGNIVALRTDATAEAAGMRIGDRIVEVEVTQADGANLRYTNTKSTATAPLPGKSLSLDPLRIADQLNAWADQKPKDKTVRLKIVRQGENTDERVSLILNWDQSFRYDYSPSVSLAAPIAINGLGLAYQVVAVVDAVEPGSVAAENGVQPEDAVIAVKLSAQDPISGEIKTGKWEDVKPQHWPAVHSLLQGTPPFQYGLKLKRGAENVEVELKGTPDTTWPMVDRGLIFSVEMRVQKADTIGQALSMGGYRTLRAIKSTYQQLYSLVSGRTSVKLLSGPITLARATYLFAGEGPWKLILLLGLISINLAVVNFLPIPILDGGHMVLLIYEAIRGKQAPERVQIVLIYIGLAAVGSLMLLAVGMDLWRLFF